MANMVRRFIAAAVFVLAAAAYFGVFPFDIVATMSWAISADEWIINNAALPGFFLLFSAVGLGLMVPDVWNLRRFFVKESKPASAEDIANLLKGVGNFFYFALRSEMPVGAPHGQNRYQWWTVAPKGIVRDLNYWVSPSTEHGVKDRRDDLTKYMSIDYNKPGLMTIHGGTFASNRAFPEGKYLIEFDDTNGHWDEWLTVYQQDGKLRQRILVRNDKGGILHETEDETDFNNP